MTKFVTFVPRFLSRARKTSNYSHQLGIVTQKPLALSAIRALLLCPCAERVVGCCDQRKKPLAKKTGPRHLVFATRFSDTPLDCSFVSFSPHQTFGGILFKLSRRGGGKVESVLCFPSAAFFPWPSSCHRLQPLMLVVVAARFGKCNLPDCCKSASTRRKPGKKAGLPD